MKLNWGTGITIFLMLFIGFILTLVVKAHQTKTDLYATDYYDQELNYQHTINAEKRGDEFVNAFDVFVNEEGEVVVCFPKWMDETQKGKVEFYRPDNAELDRTFSYSNAKNDSLIITNSEFVAGFYNTIITWRKNEQDYQLAKEIEIKK